MLSVIITAYKESKTIGKAIENIIPQLNPKDELIVVCPDKETKTAALKYKKVKCIQDPGKGKPTALNLAFKKAKGKIIILTDGDVYISEDAIKNLIESFKEEKVGAVSGRPISINPRNTMLGYFSHLLTDIGAHEERLKLDKKNKYLICSGYFMVIRKGIIKEIPENSLSDDAVISNLIYSKGYKIKYEQEAKVFVKYPTTLKDWIKQKRRSAGGYLQIKKLTGREDEMRSFVKESYGIFRVFSYAKTPKEFLWTIFLIFLRVYLWLDIFINIKLRKKDFSKIWKRVETTK